MVILLFVELIENGISSGKQLLSKFHLIIRHLLNLMKCIQDYKDALRSQYRAASRAYSRSRGMSTQERATLYNKMVKAKNDWKSCT